MGRARAPRRSDDRRSVPARRPGLRLAVPALLTGVLVARTASPSFTDEHDRAFPTQQEIAAAEERVADRARDVGAIRASLLLADQRLEGAGVEAEIAALVASSYQHAGQLTALNALMGADGPEGVLDQHVTFQGVSDTLQAGYDRYAASYALARSFEEHAVRVRVKAEGLAEEAWAAKERAEQAVAAAQLTAARAEQDRAEQDRADRERAGREAPEATEALARAEREAAAGEREAATRTSSNTPQPASPRRHRLRHCRLHPLAAVTEPPKPSPSPRPSSVSPTSGGAAGPDAWDCSGLMLEAWARSGAALPHYSAAQHYAGTPVSAGSLRTGHLVLWGTSRDRTRSTTSRCTSATGRSSMLRAPAGRCRSTACTTDAPNFFARV